MTIEEIYSLFRKNPSVQTDTRKIKKGDIFFALKGPSHNGNHYAQLAVDLGAAYCIVDEETGIQDERIITVTDSLKTLQALALEHRNTFKIPFIAITGSNGKTTTKELVHAVLSSQFRTSTTAGNLNNHIGIPLTILKIKTETEIAVIEMGANHQKEIAGYCTYTLPTHGLVTNCGKAHLEGFGGVEGIKKGKGELFDFLRDQKGMAFVNADYDYLHSMCKGIENIFWYGSSSHEMLSGKIYNDEAFLKIEITKGSDIGKIETQLIGGYNLPNVLAAIAIGKHFGVPDEKIKDAIEAYHPDNSRSQLLEKDGNRIILDAYNANPSSMKLAVENIAGMKGSKKILILGGMMELGEESRQEHEMLVRYIEKFHWDAVVLVGEGFKGIGEQYLHFDDALEAKSW
jgi:UDP-N-acetylmuramoyl-tripeptide--D-alanyl-D-alanine ligase